MQFCFKEALLSKSIGSDNEHKNFVVKYLLI